MICKTIKYKNYFGEDRETKEYFHLNSSELTDFLFEIGGKKGDYEDAIKAIIQSDDREYIINLVKQIILKSYGQRSADGENFMKVDPLTGEQYYKKFMQSAAFEQLYMELYSDEDVLNDFIAGVMPADMQKEVRSAMKDPATMKLIVKRE